MITHGLILILILILILMQTLGDFQAELLAFLRYPFFTEQFRGTLLTAENQLNRHIDGITGATLSVRALKKLARLSLYLHQQSNKGKR